MLHSAVTPMGPELLSNTGPRVWRKAPMAFPYSSSVLENSKSARSDGLFLPLPRVFHPPFVFL